MIATALIVEDEPLQAEGLRAELFLSWPELQVLEIVGDGESAQQRALALRPDVLFLDIRIPGQSGLELAIALAEEWPDDVRFPQLVFVTAYDEYAVQAFEQQAVDYLLKPVMPERLQQSVARLKKALRAPDLEPSLNQASLQRLVDLQRAIPRPKQAALRLIQASTTTREGGSIHIVPIEQVLCFQAADKYLRVLSADQEYLIRTPLRELLPQLDRDLFWQIHRNCVVRAMVIKKVDRDAGGRLSLALNGLDERFVISRLYAHLFKAM